MDKDKKKEIINELKKKIGLILEPMIYEVGRGEIRRFIEAVEDDNRLYFDEEYARKTRYGGIVAPPGFFGLPLGEVPGIGIHLDMGILLAPFSKNLPGWVDIMESAVNGSTEFEFFKPVRPGDVLLTYYRVIDIKEKEGKLGQMVIFTFEQTFKDKINCLVGILRTTLITY